MKKRLIVISIWGYAMDYGYMEVEELKKKNKKCLIATNMFPVTL